MANLQVASRSAAAPAAELPFSAQRPDARERDNNMSTDTAISALGRVLLHQGDCVNLAQLLPLWLSFFPVVEDTGEGVYAHGTLCTFVERNDARLLGEGGRNLPRIVGVLVGALNTDFVDDAVTARIAAILRAIPAAFHAPLVNAQTTPFLKERLQAAFQQLKG